MKLAPQRYRALHLVKYAGRLYNRNVSQDCHLIKYGTEQQFQHHLNSIAYHINVSIQAMHGIMERDYAPVRQISKDYSYYIHDVPTLKNYLEANALMGEAGTKVLTKKTGLTPEQLNHKLDHKEHFTIQQIKQIAYNIFQPQNNMVNIFKRLNYPIDKNSKQKHLAENKIKARINLVNYLACVASMNNSSYSKSAKALNMQNQSLTDLLKHASVKKINKVLKPFYGRYKHLSPKTINQIIHNNNSAQHIMLTSLAQHVYDRRSLVHFIKIYALIHNMNMTQLGKKLPINYAVSSYLQGCSLKALKKAVNRIAKVIKMNKVLKETVLRQPGLKFKQIQLPKDMYWTTNYQYDPATYLGISHDIMLPKVREAKVLQARVGIQDDIANTVKIKLHLATIVDIWSKEFGFNSQDFLKDNFVEKKYHGRLLIYAYPKNFKLFPVIGIRSWQQILDSMFKQLKNIKHAKTLNSIKRMKYAPYLKLKSAPLEVDTPENKLANQLSDRHRHTVTATFERTDVKTMPGDQYHKEYYRPIIVLSNVKYNGKKLFNVATLNYTKLLIKLNQLFSGDQLKLKALIKPKDNHYTLCDIQSAKLIHKTGDWNRTSVPSTMHALIGYSIDNNKSAGYDFTTWGHNYGYVRHCRAVYKTWLKNQEAQQKGNQHE